MSHIQQNYALQLFWRIFGEIHRELFFLFHKLTISEKSMEILSHFFFKQVLKVENPAVYLDLFKQLFLIKPVKWGKY